MLPKVATHIFHHTSRAAAAVQNQTTQAIRNAWQYQQAAPSSSSGSGGGITQWGSVGSSSGWGGSSSAGPGGAKYNAGSRFYSGYTGPGRSITQANPTSAQPDDNDERNIHPVRIKPASPVSVRTRPRSSSLSLSSQGRIDRGEGLGVLEVVQMRARHAFAVHRSITSANDPPPSTDGTVRPALVRRNSTSSQSVTSSEINVDMPPPPSTPITDFALSQSGIETDITDPERPQPVDEPLIGEDVAVYERIRAASHSRDLNRILDEVELYRHQPHVSVPCYNMLMQALYDNRVSGQPVSLILDLYNEMLDRGLLPNYRTYKIMILSLCARDVDVHRVISSLTNRISRRTFAAQVDASASSVDQQRITQLRAETNYTSALTLFQAATVVRDESLGLPQYNALIRSCALHNNVEAALRVFAHMERFPEELPSPVTYSLLLSVFCNVADLGGAQQVFNDFKEASRGGRVAWNWSYKAKTPVSGDYLKRRHELSRRTQIQIWNKMIDTYFKCGEPAAAVELFETMLDTPRGQDFEEIDVPLPNAITYTSIIAGFCEAGDMQSALSWFDRLLAQPSVANDPFSPLSDAPRPDQIAWITMLDTLARMGHVDDLNRLFTKLQKCAPQDDLPVRAIDRFAIMRANFNEMEAPDTDPARAARLLDFVLSHVMDLNKSHTGLALNSAPARSMLTEVVRELTAREDYDKALDLTERYVVRERKLIDEDEADGTVDASQTLYRQKGLRGLVQTLSGILLSSKLEGSLPTARILPIKSALRVASLSEYMYLEPQKGISSWYIHSYTESKRLGLPVDLSLREWELLFKAFLAIEMPALDPPNQDTVSEENSSPPDFVYPGLASLLGDLAQTNHDMNEFNSSVIRKTLRALVYTHGSEELVRIVRDLGPRFSFLLDLPGFDGVSHGSGAQKGGELLPTQEAHNGGVHIDLYHSRYVDEWFPANPKVSAQTAYDRYEAGAKRGMYPSPECLGRLIGGLGRLGDVNKVRELYQAAQHVLASLEDQKRWQSAGWFVVEDQMVIAFAHAGEYDAAHVHRMRIFEHGGTPSADAYGALISSLKDTTDDTAHAMQLWEEALARDVRPNIFMYNTIISKLAKARKADHALAIFQQMKEQGTRPSSVTYGALIAACCRVGDAMSAEHLFNEMSTSHGFRPRVPPYNTMIQLYTYTKPDRERVLHYYDELLAAGIKPTAHTYKLLLEAYGTIEPFDAAAMEDIFRRICDSPHIEVQGTHWAALINAYGCVGKDLNQAIGIFESIENHPSTARAKTRLPDAVAYEALFTVFALHRRPDLIRAYLQRLRDSHIHPTAYVANATIKGYAAAGDIESARAMFESLEDPSMGVAAPHNHSPHEPQRSSTEVPPQAPIYREPSTWEVMVRAELGVSERERAMDLIRRMEFRGYPSAVVQRVRDIMHTDALGESPTVSSLSPISSS